MKMVSDVTTQDFESAVGSGAGLVLLDLWAPWCAPCRALLPVLEDLAADFAGDLAVRKIDIEAEAELRARLGATTVPTLILYRDGAEVDRVIGARSRARLSAWIESHL